MAKKTKLPTLVSPPLEVKYSHLDKPNCKFKEEGEFQLTGVLDPADPKHVEFMQLLDKQASDARTEKGDGKPKVAKYELFTGYKPEEDKDGNETGKVVVSFKNGASFEYKGETIQTKITIVDSKKNPMVNAKVGRGSIVRVAYQAVPFANDAAKNVGISLRFSAVQVIKYVPFTGSAASVFDEVAEGFECDETDGTIEESTATEPQKTTNGDF